MQRRTLLKSLPLGLAAGAFAPSPRARGAIPKMKITRVRYYHVGGAGVRPIFNQSSHVVVIETDQGLTGIGEDPSRIEHLWQLMYRHYFYPPGREKVHALGAIDLALWDLKAKALGVPVYELLGGLTREYLECYATGFPPQGTLQETARACIEFGYRAFRFHGADPEDPSQGYVARKMVDRTFEMCREIREGVGEEGDWAIDFHTRLDLPDAVRLCGLIEPLRPLFVEDAVRSENKEVYQRFRPMVSVPLAVGEHYGDRWDSNAMIENHLFDYSRVTLPNSGGITDYMKHAAICETHYVGLVPHFTGPIAEAALVHCLAASSGMALMEMRGTGDPGAPHLPEVYDFRRGRLYPRDKPGLGIVFDPSRADQVLDVTERHRPIPLHQRPDGSITNW